MRRRASELRKAALDDNSSSLKRSKSFEFSLEAIATATNNTPRIRLLFSLDRNAVLIAFERVVAGR